MAKNHLQPSDPPALIASVHASFVSLGQVPEPEVSAEPLRPAVPIRNPITDDRLIRLEDGHKLKSMKRYLAGLGMTPDE